MSAPVVRARVVIEGDWPLGMVKDLVQLVADATPRDGRASIELTAPEGTVIS